MQKEERQKNEDRMKEAVEEMKEKEQVITLVIQNFYILYDSMLIYTLQYISMWDREVPSTSMYFHQLPSSVSLLTRGPIQSTCMRSVELCASEA